MVNGFTDFNAILLFIAVILPLALGGLLLLGGRFPHRLNRALALVGFAAPLVISLWLFRCFDATAAESGFVFQSRFATGLEALGIYLHLGLNGISLALVLLTGVVGLAAGLFAMQSQAERGHLYLALLLIMLGGLVGTFASIDLFFFYFFHEFALIPTFIMIGIWGGAGRRTAAIEMTIYLTAGALLSLLGLIALYWNSGAETFSIIALREYLAAEPLSATVQNNIFPLLLVGFGILVSLFPFHSWAPRGYGVAPTAAAMLHAGVLKKFGLYGLLQIAAPLLPLGAMEWQSWLLWLALGNVLIIGLITLAQNDLKQMIGYASVMHMGYCFLGIATFSVIGAGGVIILMVAHGMSVALLFLLSTCIYHRSQTFDMGAMGGLARKTPVLAAFFVVATMASIGLPGFGNFIGEFTIFMSLGESEATRWIVLPTAIGIIISAVYGLRAVARTFFGNAHEGILKRFEKGEIEDLRWSERLPAGFLVVGLLIVGLWPAVLTDNASDAVESIYGRAPVEQSALVLQVETAAMESLALLTSDLHSNER
jgi:NADH-quinone oxidoreductase subunit M